jgi:hypothetical protein
LLAALGVENARDGVKGTKKEVYGRLERLYGELAKSQDGRLKGFSQAV